jgi:MFS family permease
MQSVRYGELLRSNKNFRRLWFGQVISELGTWFSFIAELGVVSLLSKSVWATMALLVSRLLPVLLISPLAGVLVDRANRKTIMVVADLVRALIALGFLTASAGAPVWLIVIFSGLMSAASTFFEAAKNASIANMTTRREMLTANVLMFSTRFLQLTLGAALGGVTAAKFGYNAAFIVNSLSFLASAAFIGLIPHVVMRSRRSSGAEGAGGDDAGGQPRTHFISDVRQGLTYIRDTPFVRAIILVNVGWATGGGMNNLVFDRLSRYELAGGAGGSVHGASGDWNMAVLMTAAGAGLFIGMAMARRAGAWASDERRANHFIGWSLLLHGLCFAVIGLMPSLAMMSFWLVVSRLILGAEFGVQETLMMRALPDEYRGRVFTTDRALELTTMTLSMMAAGSMLSWASPRTMLIVSGGLSASPGLVWLLAMWRSRFSVPARVVREGYSSCP